MKPLIETKNARIMRTMLGREEHGILTFFLTLDYGGTIQTGGGIAIDENTGMKLITKILDVVGVNSWEELIDKHIRVKTSRNKVYAISHFLVDNWLDFEEFMKHETNN